MMKDHPLASRIVNNPVDGAGIGRIRCWISDTVPTCLLSVSQSLRCSASRVFLCRVRTPSPAISRVDEKRILGRNQHSVPRSRRPEVVSVGATVQVIAGHYARFAGKNVLRQRRYTRWRIYGWCAPREVVDPLGFPRMSAELSPVPSWQLRSTPSLLPHLD